MKEQLKEFEKIKKTIKDPELKKELDRKIKNLKNKEVLK